MSLVTKSDIIAEISNELSIPEFKVTNTVDLLVEGNTVPFISAITGCFVDLFHDTVKKELVISLKLMLEISTIIGNN